MKEINCLEDTYSVSHDAELWREVYGYLSVCLSEVDDEDDHDLNFLVFAVEDMPLLHDMGEPEEWARIEIHGYGQVRTIYRAVYVSEVLFIPGEFADQIPFNLWSQP